MRRALRVFQNYVRELMKGMRRDRVVHVSNMYNHIALVSNANARQYLLDLLFTRVNASVVHEHSQLQRRQHPLAPIFRSTGGARMWLTDETRDNNRQNIRANRYRPY